MRTSSWKALRDSAFILTILPALLALPACGDGSPQDYSVEIAVSSDSGRMGALGIEISYIGREGSFIGRGDHVECIALVEAIVAANSQVERTTLISMISLEGIRTPTLLMRCGFRSGDVVTPEDFEIDVTDASDTNSNPIEPVPTVLVSAVVPR